MTRTVIYGHEMCRLRLGDALDIAGLLHEKGVECRTEGVNGGMLDTDYRLVFDTPTTVWRDESNDAWIVEQASPSVSR